MPIKTKIVKLYIRDLFVFFQIFVFIFVFPGVHEALAIVTFVGAGAANTRNNSAIQVTPAAGTAKGDLMIANVTAGVTTAIATPQGYTKIADITNTAYRHNIYYAVATSTPGGINLASVAQSLCAGIVTFRGASTTAPIATSTAVTNLSSATIKSATTTASIPGTMAVFVAGSGAAGGANNTANFSGWSGADLTFIEAQDKGQTAGADCSIGMAYSSKIASTTQLSSRTATHAAAAQPNSGAMILIRPDIEIAGKLYSNEGTTPYTTASKVIKLQTSATSTIYSTTTCANCGGDYKFQGLEPFREGDTIKVWTDNDVTLNAFTLTKASTTCWSCYHNAATSTYGGIMNSGISDLDLYQNRVIVRHESTSTDSDLNATSTTISDFASYDGDNDTDIQLNANGGALTVKAGQMLYVWPGTTFNPGGAVTIHGGIAVDTDGSIKLAYGSGTSTMNVATSSILNMNGNALQIAGSFFASSTPSNVRASIFNSSGTTTMIATTTGKVITATSTSFYNLEFGTTTPGAGAGAWSFGADGASTTNNFMIRTGSVTLPSTMLDIGGNFSNTGRVIAQTGTTTFNGTTTQYLSGFMVGTSTLNNLVLDNAGWEKIGGDGVNSSWNTSYDRARSIAFYNGNLYAGIGDDAGDAEVWKYNGSTWTQVGGDNVNSSWPTDASSFERVQSLKVHNGKLYAGLGLTSGTDAEVWEYNGSAWTQIGGDGANSSWNSGTYTIVAQLESYQGDLYASLSGGTNGDGEVWKYNGTSWGGALIGGDGVNGSWADSIVNGAGGLATDQNKLFASINASPANGGPQVYEYNGSTWTKIGGGGTNSSWSGGAYNVIDGALLFSDGYLYAGLGGIDGDAEVWRYNGTSWGGSPIGNDNVNGAWDGTHDSITSLAVASGNIYAGLGTVVGDTEVWEYNGTSWRKIGENTRGAWEAGGYKTVRKMMYEAGYLYAGIGSDTDGDGELWRYGVNSVFFTNNASTTNFQNAGLASTSAPSLLSVSGNYSNNGIFDANTGTVYIDSTTAQQYLSGSMVETSAFNNLTILNNFGTDAILNPGVIFTAAASTTGTFSAEVPSTKIRFKEGATSTFQNFTINGGAAGTKVSLRAATTTPLPTWNLEVPGTALVSFADVMDSNACSDNPDIDASDGTNLDADGNFCWMFTIPLNKISGTIYNDEGTTAAATGRAVWMRIGTSTPGIFATTTTETSGFYGFEGIKEAGIKAGTPITVWVDNNAAFRAAAFTIASTTSNDITGLNLYQNRVNIRHEGTTGTSTTNIDLGIYDRDNDPDIQFQANGGNLIVNSGQALYVMPGSEFKPGGSVTLDGNNSLGSIEGSLKLPTGTGQNGNATSSILTLGANTLTMAGSLLASSTSILNVTTGGFFFNATASGKTINIPSANFNLSSTTFNGTNGAWTFASPATTTGDFGISAGTVTAPSGSLYILGHYLNAGTFTHNSGNIFFASTTVGTQNLTGNMIKESAFNNVDFSGTAAKTFKNHASTTNLTINSSSGAVTAPSGTLSVSGNFANSGTFTHNSGTLLMDGTSNTFAGGDATLNNLTIDPTSAGTITLTSTGATAAGILNVATGDIFSLNANLFATSTGTITLSGTISGAGTLVIADTSGGPGTGGTLSTPVRYDATSGAIPSATLDARTGSGGAGYGGAVEIYSGSSASARTATLASGTYDFNAGLNINAANSQNITLDGTSGNPTITVGANSGNLDFTGSGSGAEIIKAGTGSLTVSGNADLTGGTFTPSTGGTLTMNGAGKTLTSNNNELQNVTLSGTITTADNLSATGTMILSGNAIILGADASTTGNVTLSAESIYPQTKDIILNGSSKTLTGGSGQIGALRVIGSYTLAGSDLITGSTTVATSSSLTIPANFTFTSTSSLAVGGTLTGAGTTTIQHSNLGGGGTFGTNFAFGTTTAGISLPSRNYASNFEVLSGTTVTASNSTTTVGANYINNGTLTANSGDFRFASISQQTLSGTMSGASAFYRLFLENTSGTDATTSPSIVFRNAASTTNTLAVFEGNVKIRFPASATSTFQNIYLNGGAAGTKVMLRSSTPATRFGFEVAGTEELIAFTDFMDTNACNDTTEMDAGTASNNADSGNNNCINFTSAVSPTISSDSNQTFEINSSGANSKITVTSGSGAGNTVRAQQELRIAIATSSANLWWATSDTSATVDGTGATKACGNSNPGPKACTVTYEGLGAAGQASVVVIPIDTDFSNGQTLTVENLTFSTGSTANAATAVIKLYLDGGTDILANATDDKTAAIQGTLTLANNTSGIEYSNWDDSLDPNNQTVSNGELFSFKLTPAGETVTASPIVINLANIQSVKCDDFSGLDAYQDSDSNGNVNGVEAATGTVSCSISGNSGTLILTNGFRHNVAVDYVLRATTFGNNNPGNSMRLSLSASDITASGFTSAVSITSSGSASEANQFRSNIAGGQGGGGGSGGGTPSGEVPTGGGGPGGGPGSTPDPTPTETPTGGGDPGGGEGTWIPSKYFFALVGFNFEKLFSWLR